LPVQLSFNPLCSFPFPILRNDPRFRTSFFFHFKVLFYTSIFRNIGRCLGISSGDFFLLPPPFWGRNSRPDFLKFPAVGCDRCSQPLGGFEAASLFIFLYLYCCFFRIFFLFFPLPWGGALHPLLPSGLVNIRSLPLPLSSNRTNLQLRLLHSFHAFPFSGVSRGSFFLDLGAFSRLNDFYCPHRSRPFKTSSSPPFGFYLTVCLVPFGGFFYGKIFCGATADFSFCTRVFPTSFPPLSLLLRFSLPPPFPWSFKDGTPPSVLIFRFFLHRLIQPVMVTFFFLPPPPLFFFCFPTLGLTENVTRYCPGTQGQSFAPFPPHVSFYKNF